MPELRLLADDLTGALDAAAQFATAARPLPVFLGHRVPGALPRDFAIDLATRERDPASSAGIVRLRAGLLQPGRGAIAFFKVDSLLRGHPSLDLAAALGAVGVAHCIVAPAFPFHGRVTRGGLQHVLQAGSASRVGEDMFSTLTSIGLRVHRARPGQAVPHGVSLWDAETDADLLRIARSGLELAEPVLWCGTAGLASALAGGAAPTFGRWERPLLGVFGSDHPVTAGQLAACGQEVLSCTDAGPELCRQISLRLESPGLCLLRFDLPRGLGRTAAAERIARALSEVSRFVRTPASLLVSGGETLSALCGALGTDHLSVRGQALPGVPVSTMAGGRWDGTRVLSKSGAFGEERLVRWLVSPESP